MQIEVTQASADCQLAICTTPAVSADETTGSADALLFCSRFVVDSEAHGTLRGGQHSSGVTDVAYEQSRPGLDVR